MSRSAILLAFVVALSAPALAHHGFGTFELNKTVSFNGATLTKVEFLNPHGWLYFDARDESGRVRKMRCELRSRTRTPATCRRSSSRTARAWIATAST
jgi:hypothetical protein